MRVEFFLKKSIYQNTMILNQNDSLCLYGSIPSTKVLGPFLRYALWVQGCRHDCPDCMSSDAKALNGGFLQNIDTLSEDIIHTPHIEGITISGGEPFLQAGALSRLINTILQRKKLGVIVYTGYVYEEILDLGGNADQL